MKKLLTILLTGLVSLSLFGCQKQSAPDETIKEDEPPVEEVITEPTFEERLEGKWMSVRRYASTDDMILMYLFMGNLNWDELSEAEQEQIAKEAEGYAYDEAIPEEESLHIEFKDGLYYDPTVPEGASYQIDEEKGLITLTFADGGEYSTFIGFEGDLLRIDEMAHHILYQKVSE